MFSRDEVLRRALNEEKITRDNVEAYILHGELPESEPEDLEEGLDEGMSAQERLAQLKMGKAKAKEAIAKMKARAQQEKEAEEKKAELAQAKGKKKKKVEFEPTVRSTAASTERAKAKHTRPDTWYQRRAMGEGNLSKVMAGLQEELLEYMATWDERARERTAEMMGIDLPSPEDRARMRSAAETTYVRSVSRPVSRYTGMTFRTGS